MAKKKTSTKVAKKTVTKKAVKKKAVAKKAAVVVKKDAVEKPVKKVPPKAKVKTSVPSTKAAQDKAAKAAATAMRDIIARARDHFRKAPEQHAFTLADGRSLRDVKDLVDALDSMHENVFGHHVNEQKHDFASWVHEILQEKALAEQLRKAERTPREHQYVIYRHIVRRVW